MIYFVQSEFKINWASLVSLLIGVALGAVLFVLIYTLATLKQVKDTSYHVSEKIENVSEDEINKMVEEAQKDFLINYRQERSITWNNMKNTSLDLIKTVAKKFYPDAKEPLSELTLEEMAKLDHYIIDKIDKLMDKKGLRPLKKVKLSKIISLISAKNTIDNNAVVKSIKKSGIANVVNTLWNGVKFLNPAVWGKKLIVDPVITIVLKKICLTVIRIVGQETYHVYSKQAFLEPVSDEEILKLITKINDKDDTDETIEVNEEDINK